MQATEQVIKVNDSGTTAAVPALSILFSAGLTSANNVPNRHKYNKNHYRQ